MKLVTYLAPITIANPLRMGVDLPIPNPIWRLTDAPTLATLTLKPVNTPLCHIRIRAAKKAEYPALEGVLNLVRQNLTKTA